MLIKFDIDSPVFGKILQFLGYSSTILLFVQEYVSDLFCSHYSAFLIKSHGEFRILNMDTIPDYRPITVRFSFVSSGDLYALMPSSFINMHSKKILFFLMTCLAAELMVQAHAAGSISHTLYPLYIYLPESRCIIIDYVVT